MAGGGSFGYRLVRDSEAGSRLEIDDREARWVREIFERYASGQGVARIAHELNRLGAPSPRGGRWAVSALYGSPAKGSGVLNNELYVGRLIWNRSQWLKTPTRGSAAGSTNRGPSG
ncbi:MAG: recombinase family protein [Burkholderiaceae bacterium]